MKNLIAVTVAALATVGAQEASVPIREAIIDRDGDRIPDRVGETITLVGVLTTNPYPANSRTESRAHLQDGSAAIRLLTLDLALLTPFARGDSVLVVGKIGHYRGVAILEPDQIQRLGVGHLPEPRRVQVGDLLGERYEAQFVRVVGRIVPRREPRLSDESGEIRLYTRDVFFADAEFGRLWISEHDVEVVGIAEQYDSGPPFDCCYRLFLPDPNGLKQLPAEPPFLALLIILTVILVASGLLSISLWLRQRWVVNVTKRRAAVLMVQQHEEERRRLSRELHDETAQVFSAVKLQLGMIREMVTPELAPRLDRSLALIDTGIKSIRHVTSDLRPSLLDDLGLLPACRALVDEFNGAGNTVFRFEAPDVLPAMTHDAEVVLYRALQEALANAARHAGANSVTATVAVNGSVMVLTVRDDGRGLPPDQDPASWGRGGHLGLAGMSERVAALGGAMSMADVPGGGTELVVRLPLEVLTPREPTDRIRVLIVDDHEVFREGIRQVLTESDGFEVVAEGADATEALALAEVHEPDVVVLDITMPGESGLKIAEKLCHRVPNTRVLILSVHDHAEYALQAVQAGASGYVLKDAGPAALREAVRAVCRGEAFFSPRVAHHLSAALRRELEESDPERGLLDVLTSREHEVMAGIARGRSNKQIAAELGISHRTVESHRERLMRKLQVSSVAEITRLALQTGLVVEPSPRSSP